MRHSYKLVLVILIISILFVGYYYNVNNFLTLDYLKSNLNQFKSFYEQSPLIVIISYLTIYILASALSIPGATVLTLGAGAIFGLLLGTILVSFASTIGATIAFLISRFMMRDFIQTKFKAKIDIINKGIEKDGASYLFSLRLLPIFPYFLINLAMGLTKIKVMTFFVISQVGMLIGTIIYVNAGLQLSKINSLKGILSKELMFSFVLIAFLPIISKKIIGFMKNNKVYKKYKKPSTFDYNMIVIGGGAGGLVTAYISSAVNAKVALIEAHQMGGDCLNTGCVPSKAIIKSSKIVNAARNAEKYGLDKIDVKVDFKKIMNRVKSVIKKIEPHDSRERYRKLGVDCVDGYAEIISPWEIKVNGEILTTKNITIATGAKPFVPPIKGIDSVNYLTSDNLWGLQELPEKFVILGGGPIGLEMAQAFARLGSKVSIIEMSDRIMAKEDEDVSSFVTNKFKEEGIQVLTKHKAKEFKHIDGKNKLICEHEGNNLEIEFDKVLVAVGRRPNIKGFGLENLGISIRKNGTIEANEYMQTNYPNIYVAGDVTGPFQLTHTAAHQAWYAAVNGLFGRLKKFKVDYSVIPWATYVDPEVATVGLNEESAKSQGVPYEVTKYGIDDLDRAIADSEDHGFVKVLTVPGKDKILGATIVSNHASDMLLEFISAMKNKFGLNKILGTIHAYPSMGEANKYTAGNWKKERVSSLVINILKKLHRFERSKD